MGTRTVRAASLLALLALTVTASHIAAQPPPNPGIVSWSAGFPVANNAPPGQPNGSVDVLGNYTVNQGWTTVDAALRIKPKAGGLLQTTPLNHQNGQIGVLVAGNIVAARVGLAKGTWEVSLVVRYRLNPNPNNLPDQIIESNTVTVVIQ